MSLSGFTFLGAQPAEALFGSKKQACDRESLLQFIYRDATPEQIIEHRLKILDERISGLCQSGALTQCQTIFLKEQLVRIAQLKQKLLADGLSLHDRMKLHDKLDKLEYQASVMVFFEGKLPKKQVMARDYF